MTKNKTCPTPDNWEEFSINPVPIIGLLTLQRFLLAISVACAALTIFISYFLIAKHLHRYTEPRQQRQIIRIILVPVVYSSLSALSIINYTVAQYIQPIIDLYEAFALASIFLLFVEYVAPDHSTRLAFFATLENRKPKSFFRPSAGYTVTPGGSQPWFQRSWCTVFAYIIIAILLTLTEEISLAAGTYCETSWKPRFAHFWVRILGAFFLVYVVFYIVLFYLRMRSDPSFASHKPGLKFAALKLIVAVNLIQGFIFGALKIDTSPRMTGYDLKYGIPATVIAGEQVLFAIFFHYAFRSREYHQSMKNETGTPRPRMGWFRAAANAFNPMDLIEGIFLIPRYISGFPIGQNKSSSKSTGTRDGNRHLEPMTMATSQGYVHPSTAPQLPIYTATQFTTVNTPAASHATTRYEAVHGSAGL